MRKIIIIGNSGSGKTTLASQLAKENNLPHLDLDVLAWESPGIRKDPESTLEEINSFLEQHQSWVIEGCYGTLLQEIVNSSNELIFLNPGIETCLQNNLSRPWEPHKYDSAEAQDSNLEMLQAWVKEYETRDDEYSLQYHRKIFDEFTGYKREIKQVLK